MSEYDACINKLKYISKECEETVSSLEFILCRKISELMLNFEMAVDETINIKKKTDDPLLNACNDIRLRGEGLKKDFYATIRKKDCHAHASEYFAYPGDGEMNIDNTLYMKLTSIHFVTTIKNEAIDASRKATVSIKDSIKDILDRNYEHCNLAYHYNKILDINKQLVTLIKCNKWEEADNLVKNYRPLTCNRTPKDQTVMHLYEVETASYLWERFIKLSNDYINIHSQWSAVVQIASEIKELELQRLEKLKLITQDIYKTRIDKNTWTKIMKTKEYNLEPLVYFDPSDL